MTDYTRGDYGRFGLKSDTPRKVRSVNLTDDAWQWLASVAQEEGMSRNDFLEVLSQTQHYPFMETVDEPTEPVEDKITPLMETVAALQKQLAEVTKERDELDARNLALEEINGDLNNDIAHLNLQLADQPAQTTAPAMELPDAETLLQRLKAKHILFKGKKPICKIDGTDAQTILDLLEG